MQVVIIFRILFAIVISTIATAFLSIDARASGVACVQNILTNVGFDAGEADGKFGAKTASAFRSYVAHWRSRDSKLRQNLQTHSEPSNQNSEFWCEYLTEKHPARSMFGRQFFRGDVVPEATWQHAFGNGWTIRLLGKWDLPPSDIAIHIHGDNSTIDGFIYDCQRVASTMPLDASLLCIQRPYSGNSSLRRQKKEVQELIRLADQLRAIWPDSKLHCHGHSGGGHSCVTIAQNLDLEMGCVVASAPVLAVKAWSRIINNGGIGKLSKSAYDPTDHVTGTQAERIIVVGDRSDPTVPYRVWEEFIETSKEAGVSVEYQQESGLGHGTQGVGARTLFKCISELNTQ